MLRRVVKITMKILLKSKTDDPPGSIATCIFKLEGRGGASRVHMWCRVRSLGKQVVRFSGFLCKKGKSWPESDTELRNHSLKNVAESKVLFE